MRRKRIIVTAPENYSRRVQEALARRAEQTNIEATYLPLISTTRLEDLCLMERFLDEVAKFDYIIFCSRKAIECFAEYVAELGVILPKSVGYCAIGKDNEALKQYLNIDPSFIASEPSPRGIVNWLEQRGITDKRVAVLAPIVRGLQTPDTVPMFVEGLKEIGMDVHEVGCYITQGCEVTTELQSIVATADGVAFCSGTEVDQFIRSVGLEATQHLTTMFFGPYTANYARKLAIRADLINQNFENFDQFITNIEDYFRLLR
ncbi:MAG: uroporphyrinogen-III synthase [Rikenellaceae bacterium]